MATMDSAYLLALWNRLTSRPATDEVTDATKYQYLAESQNNVIGDIAARAPWVLYGAPGTLSTTDNKVFTFGTDSNGFPIFPEGKVKIFSSLGSIPYSPLIEGADYLSEGNQIRIPNNGTYTGTLYWRGITPPADIAAATQPVLQPPPARHLIVLDAAFRFQRDNSQPDSAARLQGDFAHEFARWMLVYKTQYVNGGGLGLRADQAIDGTAARIDVSGYPFAGL